MTTRESTDGRAVLARPRRQRPTVASLVDAAADAIVKQAPDVVELNTFLEVPAAEMVSALKARIQQLQVQQEQRARSFSPTGSTRRVELEQASLAGRQRLVELKHVISLDELCSRTGLKAAALYKAVTEKRLFVLEIGAQRYYPAFYGNPIFQRKQLEKISRILGDLSGWSKWQFFMRESALLDGRTPLEQVEIGGLAEVERAARAFAER